MIYLKPLPRFLLNHEFWRDELCNDGNKDWDEDRAGEFCLALSKHEKRKLGIWNTNITHLSRDLHGSFRSTLFLYLVDTMGVRPPHRPYP